MFRRRNARWEFRDSELSDLRIPSHHRPVDAFAYHKLRAQPSGPSRACPTASPKVRTACAGRSSPALQSERESRFPSAPWRRVFSYPLHTVRSVYKGWPYDIAPRSSTPGYVLPLLPERGRDAAAPARNPEARIRRDPASPKRGLHPALDWPADETCLAPPHSDRPHRVSRPSPTSLQAKKA